MGLPEELAATATEIGNLNNQTQATMRRAVSTAYYALFHRLIESACSNWPELQRSKVARQFDHRTMKEVSDATAKRCAPGTDLFAVSSTFVHLQRQRHIADYDLSVEFNAFDVVVELARLYEAFEAWERIKTDPEAQDYLFSLLFKEKRA